MLAQQIVRPLTIWIFITALFFWQALALKAPSDTITTVTGLHVPLSAIRARLPTSIATASTSDSIASRIYHLLPDGRLRSQRHDIHLRLLTERRPVTIDAATSHVVDNVVKRSPLQTKAHVRYNADGFVAIFYGPDDELVHFSGAGIHLLQVGGVHQAVFVNIHPIPNEEMGPETELPPILATPTTSASPRTNSTLGQHVSGESCADGTPHYLEIALAFDHMLCRFYDNDIAKTLTILHALVAATSVPFLSDTCVRLAVVHIEGYCSRRRDPYRRLSTLPNIDLASALVTLWQKPTRIAVRRDVVYYVSGSADGTTLLGFSIPRTVCDQERAFGWVQGVVPGVLAHLIGQTLGARRTYASEGGIMAAFYNWGPLSTFRAPAVEQMTSFIDSEGASSCLSSERPPANATVFPVVTEQPVDALTLPPYGTCAYNKPPTAVLACTSSMLGLLGHLPALTDGHFGDSVGDVRGGSLSVRTWQEGGYFHAEISAVEQDVRIVAFAGNQTTNSTLSETNFPLKARATPARRIRLSLPITWLKWPRRRLTCCGERAYVYVHARWCRPRYWRGGRRCSTAFRMLGRVMECVSPCADVPDGVVVPMSTESQCPFCRVSSSRTARDD